MTAEKQRPRGDVEAIQRGEWVDEYLVCEHPAWADPLHCSDPADAIRAALSATAGGHDLATVSILHKRVWRMRYSVDQFAQLDRNTLRTPRYAPSPTECASLSAIAHRLDAIADALDATVSRRFFDLYAQSATTRIREELKDDA